MKHIFGFMVIIGTIFYAILSVGKFNIFLDIPSLIFITGLVFGCIFSNLGIEGLKNLSLPQNRLKFFSIGKISSLVAGVIGTIIGIIQMLNYLGDPTMIGPALGVSLLTFFYSILLFFFFIALEGNKNTIPKMPNGGYALLITGFCVNLLMVYLVLNHSVLAA